MSKHVRIYAAGLAAMLAAAAADAEECKLGRYASMDLIGQETGVPRIAGTVNGKAAGFIVDTGGAWSFLTSALAEGLPVWLLPKNKALLDATDTPVREFVTVDELALGPLKAAKVQFLKGAVNTIGTNILQFYDVEIDPVERKLNLFKHKTCDGPAAYWPHSDLAVVPFKLERSALLSVDVKLDGKHLQALVDTGTDLTILNDLEARNGFHIELDSPGSEATTKAQGATGKAFDQFRHQFGKMEIGNLVIEHPWVRIGVHDLAFFQSGSMQQPLLLGMSTLAPFHIYIAYEERKLYLTTAQGDLDAGRKPAERSSGLDAQAEVNLRELLESAQNALKAGDLAHARSFLDRAVALAPDNPVPLSTRAEFLLKQQDKAGAQADLDRLASMPMPTAADYVRRSTSYRLAKQFDRALADANAAVERAPTYAEAWDNRCWLQAVMGRLDPALADCNAALAIMPKSHNTLDIRGFVHLKAGRFDAAIADYDAALALEAKYASSLYGRSLAKRRKGDVAGADADLKAARSIAPKIDEAFGT